MTSVHLDAADTDTTGEHDGPQIHPAFDARTTPDAAAAGDLELRRR